MIGFSVELKGLREAVQAMEGMSDAIKRKYLRIATNAAGGMIKNEAVSRVPQRTKLLKQALGVKVTQKRNGEWYAVIGAKRGMKRGVKVSRSGNIRKMGKRTTSNLRFTPGGQFVRVIDPARYIHLAEKGTKSHVVRVKNKKVLSDGGTIYGRHARVSAKPANFLAIAAQRVGAAATAKAVEKLKEQIEKHKKAQDTYYRDDKGRFRRR